MLVFLTLPKTFGKKTHLNCSPSNPQPTPKPPASYLLGFFPQGNPSH